MNGSVRARARSPRRTPARNLCRELGGELKQFYALLGRYDAAAILEAPDDERAARIAAAIGRLGNVRTETIRAFSEAEYRQLLSFASRIELTQPAPGAGRAEAPLVMSPARGAGR